MRLERKVALVTGASRGIGFAVSELFAREGATVYAGSTSNPSGVFPTGVTGVELDVSKEEHWKRVVTFNRLKNAPNLLGTADIVRDACGC